MTARLVVTLIMLVMVTCLVSGCQMGAPDPAAVLVNTLEAVNDADSYEFEMEIFQEMRGDEDGDLKTDTITRGQVILDPMSMKMDMQTTAAGMEMEMTMYLVDETMYMSVPFMGWVSVGVDDPEGHLLEQSYEDPLEYVEKLRELDPDGVTLEEDGDNYVLVYKDEAGELANLLQEEMDEQLGFGVLDSAEAPEVEGEGTEFSDVVFSLVVDRQTYLPVEHSLSFALNMDLMGDEVGMDQEIKVKFLDFGTVDEIEVPDEAREEAVPFDELF